MNFNNFTLALLLFFAPPTFADENCKQCPAGRKETFLFITDYDLAESVSPSNMSSIYFVPKIDYKSIYGERESVNRLEIKAKSSKDLISKLQDLVKNECIKISGISFFNHGEAGSIWFGNTKLNAAQLENLKNISCIMSPQATIYLNSCNSGRGCSGENFMRSIAHTFLSGGGTIVANTSYAVTTSFTPKPIPINFNPQSLYISNWQSGKLGWANDPMNCAEYYTDKMSYLDSVDAALKSCNISVPKDYQSALDAAINGLDFLVKNYARSNWKPNTYNPKEHVSFKNTDSSLVDFNLNQLEKLETSEIKSCISKSIKSTPTAPNQHHRQNGVR